MMPSTNSAAAATSVIYLAWFVAAKFTALAAGTLHSIRSEARLAQHRDFCLPHLHSTPPLGGGGFPSEYCHTVWYRKTRMAWLPDGEKKFEGMFIRFDRIHERDGHTDTA